MFERPLVGEHTHQQAGCVPEKETERSMIALGVLFLLLGFFLGVPILWTIGLILLIVGAVLAIAGAMGRPFGSRSHYF